MPNSTSAFRTQTCSSCHCTKMITFAVGSPAKISFRVEATTLNFEPYFAECSPTLGQTAARGASPTTAMPSSWSSSARGCTSCNRTGARQSGHCAWVASDAFKHGTQKTWQQGVIAILCTGRSSVMQTLQLLAFESCCRRRSVVEKNCKLMAASRTSSNCLCRAAHVSLSMASCVAKGTFLAALQTRRRDSSASRFDLGDERLQFSPGESSPSARGASSGRAEKSRRAAVSCGGGSIACL
mmetsp:Transcript_92284/g.265548  ORF Transcript_92284/g.265548 Transcript_92284/m.265548 type:complete len:240 (+) Transcript_92284:345-1064(+)